MIPQFTADASLSRSRANYVPARHARSRDTAFVSQEMLSTERGPLPEDGGALELGGGTTILCPGCATHPCGFLGLGTCLTCC